MGELGEKLWLHLLVIKSDLPTVEQGESRASLCRLPSADGDSGTGPYMMLVCTSSTVSPAGCVRVSPGGGCKAGIS